MILKSNVQEQLSLLVHLSKADDFVSEFETKMVYYLGDVYGLSKKDVDAIVENPIPIPKLGLEDLSLDSKFEYLFNTVQLMKVDGKVHQSEVLFCKKIAFKLGYKPSVISNLSSYVYSDPNIITDKTFLRSVADRHLISREVTSNFATEFNNLNTMFRST